MDMDQRDLQNLRPRSKVNRADEMFDAGVRHFFGLKS